MNLKVFLMATLIIANGLKAQLKNCSLPELGFVPIPDLQKETFRNFSGGLYSEGTNIMPTAYLLNGIQLSKSIQPMDTKGQIQNSGKIVFIGVGASNPRTEFSAFQRIMDTSSRKKENVILVNTCIGGQGVQKMNGLNDNYWKSAQHQFDSLQLSFLQVQVAWVETENTQSADTSFPSAPQKFLQDLKILLQTMKVHFPNLQLVYLSARAYSGWIDVSSGSAIGKGLLAPRDYYNGWAIKWLVDSAVQSKASFNYLGSDKKIPMPLYGNYSYTNGSQLRNNGFSLNCETDFAADGLHLTSSGEQKIALLMFDFFAEDTLADYWLWKSNRTLETSKVFNLSGVVYPNPVKDRIFFSADFDFKYVTELRISNTLGECILLINPLSNSSVDISQLCPGTYVLNCLDYQQNILKTERIIKL